MHSKRTIVAALTCSVAFGLATPAFGGSPAQNRGMTREATSERTNTAALPLLVGAASRVITPTAFETFDDVNQDATWQEGSEAFYDFGVDRLDDPQEPGALGPDGKPGLAGVDDDRNGRVDDVSEYLAPGSDDVDDPAHDNFDAVTNPTGTEGDGIFQRVVMAGFQGFLGTDTRPAQGIHDDLYARALVVTQGSTSFVLIVVDLIGIQFQFMNPVKRSLWDTHGIPFENTIIAATHTHQGPDTVGIWAGEVDPEYMSFVMDQMKYAAWDALAAREQVQMRSSVAEPPGCYDRETLVLLPPADCALADYESANLSGDPSLDQYVLQNDLRDPWVRRMEIPVAQFVTADGRTIATLTNFDDHPEVFLDENSYLSSDFPAYVRRGMEDAFGGVAIYVSGTLGSQMGALRGAPIPFRDEEGVATYQVGVTDGEGNPVPVWATETEDRMRSLGYDVAAYASDALASAPLASSSTLSISTRYLDVSLDNPFYRLLIRSISNTSLFDEDEYIVHAPYCSQAGCLRTPISVVWLGNTVMVTAPGEFPPEYAVGRPESVTPYSQTDPGYEDYVFPSMVSLQAQVPSRDLFFIGLANNYFGYAIPKSDTLPYSETDHPNFYEEEYNTSLCFGDSVGNRLMELLGSSQRYGNCVPMPRN